MRRRLLAAALAAMLLSGCSWLDGSYVSVSPHQVGINQPAGTSARKISTYTELRNALVELVDAGSREGLFSTAEYPRDTVLTDMDRAVSYVRDRYAPGAYAVERIVYNFGTGLGGSAIAVEIDYRSDAKPLEAVRTVRWMSGAEEAIHNALDECSDGLVLQITGYQDVDLVQLVLDYARENPDRVMETPAVTVGVYPNSGDTRVVELQFQYRTPQEELRNMREQVQPVFSSAALYVTGNANEQTKFSQLYAFLTERFDYTMETSTTPAYSLLCQGKGDSRAFAQVYAAMCRRIGLEARSIQGTLDEKSHWWNQISIDGEWYYVDLLSSQWFRTLDASDLMHYAWEEKE